MRITFFVHRFWPSVGGVEKYVEQLSRALLGMGHEIDIVAGAHGTSPLAKWGLRGVGMPEHEILDGLRIHRFPALRSPLRCRAWFWRHLRLFREADVVSVSNTHMLEYFWGMLGPAMSVRKVFLIRHGMKMTYPVPEADIIRARRAQRLAAGVAHDGRFIGKWLGVTPDICPDQGLFPTADELPIVPEPPPNSAAFIGRLEPDTGIRTYIDAVALLNGRESPSRHVEAAGVSPPPQRRGAFVGVRGGRGSLNPVGISPLPQSGGAPGGEANVRFRLEVYGDGSLLPALREKVEDERLPVIFHGRRADAQELLANACFAFVDGRMAIQEAMARRRVVFAAYTNPLKREYVCGESFSPFLEAVGSAEELAGRVGHYIRYPEERRRKVEAAFQCARGLSWERTAEEYLACWQRRLTTKDTKLRKAANAVASAGVG